MSASSTLKQTIINDIFSTCDAFDLVKILIISANKSVFGKQTYNYWSAVEDLINSNFELIFNNLNSYCEDELIIEEILSYAAMVIVEDAEESEVLHHLIANDTYIPTKYRVFILKKIAGSLNQKYDIKLYNKITAALT